LDASLRVLLIDDDPDDHELAADVLREAYGARFQLDWAATFDQGLEALCRGGVDVCLLDYQLGAKTGLDVLRAAAARRVDVPIVLLTGQGQREIDLEAMRAGAADYLTKDKLSADTLERTIRHSLERHRDRKALRQLNEALEGRVEERTRALERANAALKEEDRRKDEFLAILAHELRNPLAPIANSIEILKQFEGNGELCRQARDTMGRQLALLVRLVDDLLEVSRIRRGKIELRRSRVELSVIVRQAVEGVEPYARRKGQRVDVSIPAESIPLDADSVRLTQVIGNLLNNAAKFTPSGGHIELAVERKGDEVSIRVRDDGIGIAPEQLERIFEMFTQLDSSLERSEVGLGIGLTLVRNLVELHGGSIEARSAGTGRGSEFVIRLPVAEAGRMPSDDRASTTSAAARSTEPTVQRGAGLKVLLVDDNRDAAHTMAMLLRYDKHDVVIGADGLEAVETAARIEPDVVLLDIGLPTLNGYEAARRIREQLGDAVTLIAVTGWGQEEDRQKSKEAGFDHHLTKPVEPQVLMKMVRDLAPGSRGGVTKRQVQE
jgi:signal transduction histidine kinase